MSNEKKIANYPDFVNIKGTEIILEQMKKSICKIYKGEGESGTGFFCCIPYKNQELEVFITNYHVIDNNYITNNEKINIGINNNLINMDIPLENDRKIYLSKDNDLAIIEMKYKDHLNQINVLKLDDNLLKDDDPKKFYETENSIYIIQYPKEACVSYSILKNIDNNEIKHVCCTESGSSGSPILSLKTNKVIGVHKAGKDHFNFNSGIFFGYIIKKLSDEMKIIKEIKKDEDNNNIIQEMLNNNLISKEELEYNKVFGNNGNIYKKEQKDDLGEGLLENVKMNKNEGRYIEVPKFNNSKAQTFEVKLEQNGQKYFKKPLFHGEYNDPCSIVDGLKSIGEDSSKEYRAKIAYVNGIIDGIEMFETHNYRANSEMIKLLKEGKLKKP